MDSLSNSSRSQSEDSDDSNSSNDSIPSLSSNTTIGDNSDSSSDNVVVFVGRRNLRRTPSPHNEAESSSNNVSTVERETTTVVHLPDEIVLQILLYASKVEGLNMYMFNFPSPAAACLKWFMISFNYYYQNYGWLHGKKYLFEDWLKAAHFKNYGFCKTGGEASTNIDKLTITATQVDLSRAPSMNPIVEEASVTKRAKVDSNVPGRIEFKADTLPRAARMKPKKKSARDRAIDWYNTRRKKSDSSSSTSTFTPAAQKAIDTISSSNVSCSACQVRA